MFLKASKWNVKDHTLQQLTRMSATKIHELHLCTGHAVLGSYYTNHSIFHVKVAQFYAGVRGITTQLSNLSPATF